MILTPEEIRELTGKKFKALQERELRHMGIPFKTRIDGSLVVMKSDVDKHSREESTPFFGVLPDFSKVV